MKGPAAVSVFGGDVVWMHLGPDVEYVARVKWADSGALLVVVRPTPDACHSFKNSDIQGYVRSSPPPVGCNKGLQATRPPIGVGMWTGNVVPT